MQTTTNAAPQGRRERNKQDKLNRIISAATELFSDRGIDDVTTQEIADRADIGAGTLFLYVKSKGDLLLLVQNTLYSAALDRGLEASRLTSSPTDALMSLLEPIIACNRAQVDNGRTYLREMVFGDATEPNHAAALQIVERTEQAASATLRRLGVATADDADVLAHVLSAVVFLTLSVAPDSPTIADLSAEIRGQIDAILRPRLRTAESE